MIKNELQPAKTKKNSGIVTEACASWFPEWAGGLGVDALQDQLMPVIEREHGKRRTDRLPEIIKVVKGLFDLERLDYFLPTPNLLYCGCFMGYLTLQPMEFVAFGPQIVRPLGQP